MESLTALSVASSAVQFVDFSAKLLSKIHEICKSETGYTVELQQLKDDTERLRILNSLLKRAIDPENLKRSLTPLELEVVSLAGDCDREAHQLSKTLKSVSAPSRKNKWAAVRSAVKSMWHQRDIDQLRQRLDNSRQLLTTSILVQLQEAVNTSSHNKAVPALLDDFSWEGTQTLQDWLIGQRKETKQWQDNLLQAVTNIGLPLSLRSSPPEPPKELPLSTWPKTPVATNLRLTLLESLEYEEMSYRQERVAKAFTKTFEWVFHGPLLANDEDPPWSSFREWLRSGSDVYWITGKAGSGKSTLMKFIYQDKRTRGLLLDWRPGHPLITAAFYFWNSGTTLQMSQEGLLRSLLHQAIEARWHVVKKSLPTKLDAFSLSKDYSKPWTRTELVQAFRFLLEEDEDPSVSYVFFLDGLDEFEGDKSGLVSLVYQISSYPNVKVCVSSRPWVEFEDAFKQKPSLILQHLTYGDMRHYVHQNLSGHPGFCELSQGNALYAAQLMKNITTKASGVFLWVVLVVRSLLEGLTDGDRISDLQRRLDDIPDELEDLFKKMLKSLKPAYFKHASQLFQIFRALETRLTVLLFSFADDDPEYALRREVSPLTDDEIFYRAMSMKRRLDSRCRGLLEIEPLRGLPTARSNQHKPEHNRRDFGGDSRISVIALHAPAGTDFTVEAPAIDPNVEKGLLLARSEVGYLHRTVKDFFEGPDIWRFITSVSDSDFNPYACLCRAHILQLKTFNLRSISTSQDFLLPAVSWCLEYADMIGREDVELHVRLLDVVDQAADILASKTDDEGRFYVKRYYDSLDSHWAAEISRGVPTDTFLAFAARCHLYDYVRTKLEACKLSKTDSSRVLYTIVTNYQLPPLYSASRVCSPKEPDPRLVRLMLDHGADPNHTVTRRSAWQNILERTTVKQRQENGVWKEIVEAFKEHGAKESDTMRPPSGQRDTDFGASRPLRPEYIGPDSSIRHRGKKAWFSTILRPFLSKERDSVV